MMSQDALNERLGRLAIDARFIFTGVVERVNGSSLSLVEPGPNTVVVRVQHIHHAPPSLGSHVGQVLTIQLSGAERVKAEERLLFFTQPLVYGETMGVQELGHGPAPADLVVLDGIIGRLKADGDELQLAQRVAAAPLIVHGRVVGLRRARQDEVPFSEHDPDWWVAAVAIRRLLKGRREGEVDVRFANSRDVRWYSSPKLTPGQEAVLILQEDQLEVGGVRLVVLDPRDVRPSEAAEIERITRLISGSSGQ